MSSRGQANTNNRDLIDSKIADIFNYPNQASQLIWGINSNNLLQISSKIIKLIKNNKIPIQLALHLIDIFSIIRIKEVQLFAELYQKILNEFSKIIQPDNKKLANLLYFKGFDFKRFFNIKTEEEVLNLYSTESPLYYIAWDKVDDLKAKFPNLEVNKELKYDYDSLITPLDCAIKYGSELCFNYLKNMGAQYTRFSEKFAVQSGNNNIFSQLLDDGKSFYGMIDYALNYHNSEIVEYLRSNLGQVPHSISDCIYYGNYDYSAYLLSNGSGNEKINIFLLFIYIFDLSNSHYFNI